MKHMSLKVLAIMVTVLIACSNAALITFPAINTEVQVFPPATTVTTGSAGLNRLTVSIDIPFQTSDQLLFVSGTVFPPGTAVTQPTPQQLVVVWPNALTTDQSWKDVLAAVRFITLSGATNQRELSWTISNGINEVFWGNHYYFQVNAANNPKLWPEAMADCASRTFQGLQGYLLAIESQAENSFIMTQWASQTGWLSASDLNNPGTHNYTWRAGPNMGQVLTYHNWAPGEPNDWPYDQPGNTEYWIQVYSDGKWNDMLPDLRQPQYVCEFGDVGTFTPSGLVDGTASVAYVPPPPIPFECHDVHFWVEEGKFLNGDLTAPPLLNQDYHSTIYAEHGAVQNPGATGCSAFIITAFTVPAKHTPSPTGYTPIVLPFTVSSSGTFTYIHLTTYNNPVVWNGYDSFTFSAKCATDTRSCSANAYVNVVPWKAATQNAIPPAFDFSYDFYTKCEGNCRNKTQDGMWLARHTLPRLWDMQQNEAGNSVKPTVLWDSVPKATDTLEFEWSSNFALVTTYGAISNMAARFPTFEVVSYKPGSLFRPSDVLDHVAPASTGFDINCLGNQGTTFTNDKGTDVWNFDSNMQDGTLGTKYAASTSWYQKFGGKHSSCDVFETRTKACSYAPLLTPRSVQDEDATGVWKVHIRNCDVRWQGKFTWNAMNAQVLHNGNKAFLVSGGGSNAYTITGEMYNQAVQPNSWTEPARGFAWIDHKYLLTVVLSQDVEFEFELGVDIFTVDLQQFRYFESNGDHAFGYNMIVYPKKLNSPLTPQSAPDRRVVGFKWVEHYWIAPNNIQCPACQAVGIVPTLSPTANQCVDPESTNDAAYTGAFPSGNCGSSAARVFLYKGPATTTTDCTNTADVMVVENVPGLSPQNPSSQLCSTDYQNVTLRGKAPGSASVNLQTNGFGFEGKITLTFLLGNGEHPHFVITPQMYVKAISVDGAFAGSTSTCRGSPSWPVANDQQLPAQLCEEVDARTFGPTDWAVIFFDIKDVDESLVELIALRISIGSNTKVQLHGTPANGYEAYSASNKYKYFNYRDLKSQTALLVEPTHAPNVVPPKNTDFAFAFTPGAHNENAKLVIYCTLRIKTSRALATHRFAAQQQAQFSDNDMQERIEIRQESAAVASSRSVEAAGSQNSKTSVQDSNNSSTGSASALTTAVIILGAACAALVAVVVGMSVYIRRVSSTSTPKRINSSTA